MKVGDLIRFKKTGVIGTIIRETVKVKDAFEVLYSVKGIPPIGVFTMTNLMETAEVISESR